MVILGERLLLGLYAFSELGEPDAEGGNVSWCGLLGQGNVPGFEVVVGGGLGEGRHVRRDFIVEIGFEFTILRLWHPLLEYILHLIGDWLSLCYMLTLLINMYTCIDCRCEY